MKKYLVLLLPVFIYAEELSFLIDSALDVNHRIKASILTTKAKKKELDSQKSTYYPTVDIGAAYVSFDKFSPFISGNTLNIYANAGIDLFDGFRKSSLVKQKKNLYESSQYDLDYAKKSLTLSIVQDFFNIKSSVSMLKALEEKSNQLKVDIKRIKKFKSAGLVSGDYVDKLNSTYDANRYDIDSLKLHIKVLKNNLFLKTGIKIKSLDDATILDPKNLEFISSAAIKSLEKQSDALAAVADVTNSIYYPHVRLEDTYGFFDHSRDERLTDMGVKQIEKQNKISLTANMRLFDNGSNKKQKQALLIQKQALNEKINYQKLQEKIRYKLSIEALKTATLNIQSAKSAFISAKSAYKTIKAKFDAGIEDQVTYLDALSQKTAFWARYKKSQNDYEVAKANYYFAANKNIKEYIK